MHPHFNICARKEREADAEEYESATTVHGIFSKASNTPWIVNSYYVRERE